jgi:hypothetical protein
MLIQIRRCIELGLLGEKRFLGARKCGSRPMNTLRAGIPMSGPPRRWNAKLIPISPMSRIRLCFDEDAIQNTLVVALRARRIDVLTSPPAKGD